MATDISTESGATVTIYRFQGFPGAGAAATILTRLEHVLTEDDRTGWTEYGDGNNEPREYPPADMAVEDWFDTDGDHIGNWGSEDGEGK